MSPEDLKARRLELGLTQAELAQLLAVSKQAVSFWEQGRRPTPGQLLELALSPANQAAGLLNKKGPAA